LARRGGELAPPGIDALVRTGERTTRHQLAEPGAVVRDEAVGALGRIRKPIEESRQWRSARQAAQQQWSRCTR
jgi:hypothetical protein